VGDLLADSSKAVSLILAAGSAARSGKPAVRTALELCRSARSPSTIAGRFVRRRRDRGPISGISAAPKCRVNGLLRP